MGKISISYIKFNFASISYDESWIGYIYTGFIPVTIDYIDNDSLMRYVNNIISDHYDEIILSNLLYYNDNYGDFDTMLDLISDNALKDISINIEIACFPIDEETVEEARDAKDDCYGILLKASNVELLIKNYRYYIVKGSLSNKNHIVTLFTNMLLENYKGKVFSRSNNSHKDLKII